jgi:hypothetical protein
MTATAPRRPAETPSRNEPANPVAEFLDRVFLWLPNDSAPGIPAVGLYLLRQVTLPFVLMLAPFVILALLAPPKFNFLSLTSSNTAFTWSIVAFAFGCMALVQELGRYAFVRRAELPVRAAAIFNAVTVTVILIFYHDHLYTCIWMIAAQLAASAAIVYALRYRPYIVAVVAALVVAQTAVNVTAPRFFRPPPTAADSAPAQPAVVSTDVPPEGNMQAWAKLYPGAVLTKNETQTLMGLTDWRVQYSVQASPDQIDAFYEGLASTEGFNDKQTLLGYHRFTQDSTNNDFSYTVLKEASGTLVIFEARTFARTGSPG